MKRTFSITLALTLVLLIFCGAIPAQAGSIRHMVTGDVSEIVVDEAAGLDRSEGDVSADVHTDVYLFVDPDSASYITFYVTDEAGNPISGAAIYITYKGVTELYGTTGRDGKCSMYLFRNVEYGYRVTKAGYESAEGKFTATRETRLIHVVLRKLHKLTIILRNNGENVPNADVLVNGESFKTNAEGWVRLNRPNGVYVITVPLPDGREITRIAVINGSDVVVVIDITPDDALVPGGLYSDRFLVYDREYDPEDYELTEYAFSADDLKRLEGETDEAFAERIARYLEQNTNTIFVEAQCDREQQENAPDLDIMRNADEKLYTQRSMMPSGWLMRAWEKMGYDRVVFKNEYGALMLDMDDMHGEAMEKAFALLYGITNSKIGLRGIVTQETLETRGAFESSGVAALKNAKSVDVDQIDFSALRDWHFDFEWDQETEIEDKLPDSIYTNSTFEYRITPIEPDALRDMITDGLKGEDALVKDEIMLASAAYFEETLRRWKAEGRLTDMEADELYQMTVDGRLEIDEIERIRALFEAGELSENAVEALVNAAIEGRIYRASCWIYYHGIRMEVTSLLHGLKWISTPDALYADEYDAQLAALTEQERSAGRSTADLESRMADELEAWTEQAIAEKYEFFTIADEAAPKGEEYVPGMNTEYTPIEFICALPETDSEFYDVLKALVFRKLNVDVRYEESENEFRAEIQVGSAQLQEQHAAICSLPDTRIVGLREKQEKQ